MDRRCCIDRIATARLRSGGVSRRPAVAGRSLQDGGRSLGLLRRTRSDRAGGTPPRCVHRGPAHGRGGGGGRPPSPSGRAGTGPPARPAPGRAHHQSGRVLASDAERRGGAASARARQSLPGDAVPYGGQPLGHALGRLSAPGRQVVPIPRRAARFRPGRRGGRPVGCRRARGDRQRRGSADLRRAHPGGVASPRAGSAVGHPAGHRPRTDRRRPGAGLRSGRTALRRPPRAVLHPRRGRPDRREDPGRARGGRALRHPPQRLRARVHLRGGQRRLPECLPRPRQSFRQGTGRTPSRAGPTSWSTTTGLVRSHAAGSIPGSWRSGTPGSCTSR